MYERQGPQADIHGFNLKKDHGATVAAPCAGLPDWVDQSPEQDDNKAKPMAQTLTDAMTGQPVPTGGVLALGNFDGVHLGHRVVATEAARIGRKMGLASYALTFDPHPYSLFNGAKEPFQLMSPRTKRAALRQCGLTDVVTLAFTHAFAAIDPEAFVRDILVDGLGVRHVVVGFDYAFGAGRKGDRDLLRQILEPLGIGVTEMPPLRDETGAIVSSTRVREALKSGSVSLATRLMGCPFTLEGIVEKGDQRGRTLGFPTANIDLGPFVRPKWGVYAVKARVEGSSNPLIGVANIGNRPTIGDGKVLLEAHLFDFAGDLYGQRLEVELHAFLRPEQKFDNLDALKAQMAADATAAREILNG